MRRPAAPPPRNPFDPALKPPFKPTRARILPWATVMAGSLVTIVPVVAGLPLLPPMGLLMLLAWRLSAPLALRLWAPALLGLFDDLVSGQPLGSAMLLWQLGAFAIGVVDQRTMFRDFRQDWMVAAGVVTLCLVGGRLLALPLGAHVDGVLIAQVAIAILAFPVAVRIVAWLDRKRGAA